MITIGPAPLKVQVLDPGFAPGEAEVAAAAFLARYSRRTLDAYRHDLRRLLPGPPRPGLAVLEATRPPIIELYRCWLEEQRLAASTIDRRRSTVCGFYRLAHIDGRVASNPALALVQVREVTSKNRASPSGPTSTPSRHYARTTVRWTRRRPV